MLTGKTPQSVEFLCPKFADPKVGHNTAFLSHLGIVEVSHRFCFSSIAELQIRRSNRDNLGIIFLILESSKQTYVVTPH